LAVACCLGVLHELDTGLNGALSWGLSYL